MGTGSFPELKQSGAWCWPPTPSSAEVKERVELYLYSPSGPWLPVLGWTLPLPLPLHNSESFVYVTPIFLHFAAVLLRSGNGGASCKERTSEVSVVYVQCNCDRHGCGVGLGNLGRIERDATGFISLSSVACNWTRCNFRIEWDRQTDRPASGSEQ